MALIDVSGLTFAYEGSYDNIFEGLSFQIDTDWRLGLVGRNGRGKTTLLRLLQGALDSGGAVSTPVPMEYFPFPVDRPERDTLSVLEGLAPDLDWRIFRELSLLKVDEGVLYRPFSTLSGGEQAKALLAALFLREGTFLLIDEPTNHLDLEARQAVGRYLRRQKGFLLVSHDRSFLDACVDHVLALNKLDVQVRQGDFSAWLRDKEAQDNWERAENRRLRQDIRRLEDAARQTSGWSFQVEARKKGSQNSGLRPDRGYLGHKSAKLMKRAKTLERRQQQAIQEKSGLLRNIEQAQPLKLHPLPCPKARVIEARDAAPDYGGGPVCAPVSFTVERGECVALTGRNGAGKSSLLRLAAGFPVPHRGLFSPASGLVVSYVPQDPSFLRGDLSALAREKGIDESLLKTLLRKLDFSRVQFDKDMAELSAGQKKKVLLACSLCQSAHLYVWDEPLNYIDLFSRLQIEALIREYRPTLLLVEHDRGFLEAVAAKQVPLGPAPG